MDHARVLLPSALSVQFETAGGMDDPGFCVMSAEMRCPVTVSLHQEIEVLVCRINFHNSIPSCIPVGVSGNGGTCVEQIPIYLCKW